MGQIYEKKRFLSKSLKVSIFGKDFRNSSILVKIKENTSILVKLDRIKHFRNISIFFQNLETITILVKIFGQISIRLVKISEISQILIEKSRFWSNFLKISIDVGLSEKSRISVQILEKKNSDFGQNLLVKKISIMEKIFWNTSILVKLSKSSILVKIFEK